MQKSMIYTPPPGYYDLPYTYAFDASTLVNGNNYPNQQVYIQGGYGDFGVRRVVGLNKILAIDGTGKFQLMRASAGVYQSSSQIQAPNSPELAIVPEEWYPETGQIGFDLFGINLPANPGTAQIAFQGVRRLKGSSPLIGYKEDPKTFTYIVQAVLTTLESANTPLIINTPINNYDFLLYNIIIIKASSGSGPPPGDGDCKLWIYDQNQVKISNLPIIDSFFNGGPGSTYQNGAVVPPLMYRRNSVVEIDFYSLQTNPAVLPVAITVYLVGRKLYPCG
jgi:hypothetical protein